MPYHNFTKSEDYHFFILKYILFTLSNSIPGGIFYFLSGSTLIFWLSDSGFDKPTIGLFGLANFLHSFGFLWGPVLEKITNEDRSLNMYKLLMGLSLSGCIGGLFLLSFIEPKESPLLFFSCLVVLSIFSASYKMLLHASQMLLVKSKSWGFTEAACTTGFRIGMLISGAVALYLSTILSWANVYRLMALLCLPSLIMIIFISFDYSKSIEIEKKSWKIRFRTSFLDFFSKKDWLLIVIFMVIYRLQDGFLGGMPNLFFKEMGFSKEMISVSYKLGGLCSMTMGGFLGGYLCLRWRFRKIFFWVLLVHGMSGWIYLILQGMPGEVWALSLVVGIQEFTKGLTLSPFFSYQLNSCTQKFAITQIAFLTSIAGFTYILLGGMSGFMAEFLGWTWLFIVSSVLSIPALLFIKYIPEFHEENKNKK